MIDESDLDQRSVLSYPLQTLLNFAAKSTMPRAGAAAGTTTSSRRQRPEIDPMLQGIPAANDFRRKVEFVRTVVREWVANGGLGNSDMSRERRLRWTGARETLIVPSPSPAAVGAAAPPDQAASVPIPVPVQKHVWVTIGARAGDRRVSALVDPRFPAEIGADVDESARRRDLE